MHSTRSAPRHRSRRPGRVHRAPRSASKSRLRERGERREGVEAVDDWLRRRAIVAADRVECIDTKELVNQAAGDAQHGSTAVLALDVQLVRFLALIIVPDPRGAANVTRDFVILLLDNRPGGSRVANL